MPNSPELDFRLEALLNQKVAKVMGAGEAKQIQMAERQAQMDAFWAEREAVHEQNVAESERGVGEITQDFATSAQRTAVQLGGGVAALAATAFAVPETGHDIVRETNRIDQLLAQRLSEVSKVNEQRVSSANAMDQAENLAEYDATVADGGNSFVAGAKELGQNIWDGGGNLLENPTALSNAVVGQIPTLGIGVGARLAVSAEAVAAKAALLAERRGMTEVTKELGQEVSQQMATRNLAIGVGATEGGGAYQNTAAEILEAPIEMLAERFPEVAEQLAAGRDPEEIRGELATKAGLTAAAIQAPLAAVTSRIAAGFELDPLGLSGAAGRTLARKGLDAAADIGREGVEELIQSGTGELSGNLGMIAAGDTEQEALEGVGIAAGSGAAAGGTMAGAFQAPGMGVGVAKEVGVAALESAKAAGRKLVARGEKAMAETEAPAEEQRAAFRTAANEVADRASTTLAAQPEAAHLVAEIQSDPMLSPETAVVLRPEGETLSRVSAATRAIDLFEHSEELDDKQTGDLQFFIAKVAREMRPFAEGNDDITALLSNPLVQEIEEGVQALPDEVVQKIFAQLPTDPTADFTSEQMNAVEKTKQLLYSAPDKLTVEAAEQLVPLFQSKGTKADQIQLQLALDFAQIRETAATGMQEIKDRYKSVKTFSDVTTEINDTGFKLGDRKLNSLNDFVREVSSAVSNGEAAVAKLRLKQMGRFVEHMRTKAQAFDALAMQQLDETEIDPANGDRKYESTFATLGADGKLNKGQKAFVNLGLPTRGSEALIDNVYADAAAAAQSYNALVKAYPELGATVEVPGSPQWKTHTPKKAANVEEVAAPVQAKAPEAAPVSAAEEAPAKAVEPAKADPARDNAVAKVEDPQPTEEMINNSDEAEIDLAEQGRQLMGDTESVVDFGSSDRAGAEELNQALSMDDAAYLAAVNPEGKATEVATDEAIDAELEDTEPSSRATDVGTAGEFQLKADGDYLYAMDGENTAGLLIHKEDGTTFMVHSAYRGKGLGKAMMRELLVRKPLAKTNGLSEAAKATRLSVLKDLRAERNAPATPKTVADRFPGLRDNLVEGPEGVNQFLNGFKLAKDSRALFARMTNPVREVGKTLITAFKAEDPAAVRELFTEDQRFVDLGMDQVKALGEVFTRIVPEIVKQLNATANHVISTNKWGGAFLSNPSKEWRYTNRKSLHVMEVGGDTVTYQKQVADAIALAGVHWAVTQINNPVQYDEEAVEALFPNGDITEELRDAFRTSHYYEQPLRNLARDIASVMGLQSNADAPVDFADGMGKQLAADVMQAMSELGLITLNVLPLPDSEKVMTFIEFNKSDIDNDFEGADPRSLQPVRNRLAKPSVLTRLVLPDSRDLPSIGGAPAGIATRVRGSGQPTSSKQRTNLEVLQNIGFKINTPLTTLIGKMTPQFKELMGFTAGELKGYNQEHLKSVTGTNQGIDYGIESYVEIVSMMQAYADANEMALDDVPVHYSWDVISNGRMMANGPSPQSNKFLRELLTVNHSEVLMADPTHVLEFHLAVAQAMGIKTEQVSNPAAMQAVLDLFNGEQKDTFDEIFADILLLSGETVDDAVSDRLAENMKAVGVATERQVHALQVFARYQQAKHDGDETFKHALAFELDGKTDGPINALVHMGLHTFDAKTLTQLKQGGFIINDNERTTLNAHGKSLGDLYGVSAKHLAESLPAMLAGEPDAGRRRILSKSIELLIVLEHAGSETDSLTAAVAEIKRSIAKHGVMATNYGSGMKSIVTKIAHEFVDKVYAEISTAMKENRELDGSLIAIVETLMGSSENGFEALYAKHNYGNFKFKNWQINKLVENLVGTEDKPNVGGTLVLGIQGEMAPILESFSLMYKASALQVLSMRRAFEKAYRAKHAELVAKNEILISSGLSRNQEAEILRDLASQNPIYKTMLANGPGEGINVAQKDFNGKLVLPNAKGNLVNRQVNALNGGLSMDLNATSFPDPGVRAAALFTIGLGDATMMSQMFLKAGNMLNVYDGLEVSVGEIAQRANEVNEAVWDGWQHDALGAAADSFEQLTLPVAEMDRDEILAVFGSLRVKLSAEDKKADIKVLREMLNTQIKAWQDELRVNAARAKAMKQAIAELHVSVDHMSGGEQPYINDGLLVEDPVEWVNQRADQILADTVPATAVEGADRELAIRLGLDTDQKDGTVTDLASLNLFELQALLVTYPFKNRVSEFVVKQISRLLPENIRVYVGNPRSIAQAKSTLHPGKDLGGANEVGTFYGNDLFLTVASAETLVHELVHATTYALVARYYAGDTKGLTPGQIGAIADLEVLTNEFANLNVGKEDELTREAVELAKRTVNGHLVKGDMAAAVNEFMAWALSNKRIADMLQAKEAPKLITRLIDRVVHVVRRLLGMPNNAAVTTFLEATLGRFKVLTDEVREPSTGLELRELYMALGDTGGAGVHETHLKVTLDQLNKVLLNIPAHGMTPAQAKALTDSYNQAAEITDRFAQAGFNFSPREKLVFELVQALFASGLQLDSAAMTEFHRLHQASMEQLKPDVFLDDVTNQQPTPDELAVAQDRYNALWQVYAEDKQEKSNLLANFVAMALVHKPMRDRLAELKMPETKLDKGNLDGFLRTSVLKFFDKLGDTMLHVRPNDSQRSVVDLLMARVVKSQERAYESLRPVDSRLDQAQTFLKQKMARSALAIEDTRQNVLSKTEKGKVDGLINGVLSGTKALLTEDGAKAFAEGALMTLNGTNLPKWIRELGYEMVGVGDTNRGLALLLNRSKHVVARVRQRLREEGPQMVRDMFSKPLSKQVWETMHHAVARTDLQALLGSYTAVQLEAMLSDPAKLAAATAGLEAKLAGTHQADWIRGAEHLARYMVDRKNGAPLLARNASALARLAGTGVAVDPKVASRAVPFLDRLVSLYALQALPDSEKRLVAELLRTETAGMESMLRLLRTLVTNERGKPDAPRQKLNAWKGYVPTSTDPRTDLVLAGVSKGKELLKMGYVRVQDYVGDPNDALSGLAYYATVKTGGQATYNQGAMQTVEASVSGVDHLTGRTLDAAVKTTIDEPTVVAVITRRKQQAVSHGGDNNLLPIFDEEGNVVAYERMLDHGLIQKHLNTNHDLAKALGSWLGRQAEETLARGFNRSLVESLKATWDEAVLHGREGEFVNVSGSKDKVLADTWGSIPRDSQMLLKELFGTQVMVRKDMLNNALGYRSASVADVFTGMTALPEETRKALVKGLMGLPGIGKDTYKILLTSERTWTSLISHAKDWIVVRSGAVAVMNGFANQFQLLQSGVPLSTMFQSQARKITETLSYLRNEKRLAQLGVEIASTTNIDKRKALQREGKLLRDANQRMSIWPLIEAGELPSIVEGLSEQDEYGALADVTKWVESKVEKLPKSLSTAAKYAVISKDTALYQGMSRMVQFGDFMAKGALYDHLIKQGKSKEDAITQITEQFVNYNFLPGRARDFAESMGGTWFLSYKLRIQKIVLRSIRDNPLRFLMAGAGADILGVNSLVSSSAPAAHWGYALGPGQFFRADDVIMWRQLMD